VLPHLPPVPTRRSSDLSEGHDPFFAVQLEQVGQAMEVLEAIDTRSVAISPGQAKGVVPDGLDLPKVQVLSWLELDLAGMALTPRSEEHTSELQSRENLV